MTSHIRVGGGVAGARLGRRQGAVGSFPWALLGRYDGAPVTQGRNMVIGGNRRFSIRFCLEIEKNKLHQKYIYEFAGLWCSGVLISGGSQGGLWGDFWGPRAERLPSIGKIISVFGVDPTVQELFGSAA